jgi:hypothetical protein
MRKLIYPTLFVIVGMMLSSMTATQAIPAQSTYNACVKKSSGAMRIVSASKKCAKKERKISWNAPGVPGPQGLQGEPGPAGEDGADGADGGYEVFVTGADFATYFFSTTTKLEQLNFDGAPRLVWTLPAESSYGGGSELIWASFARPQSWDGATSAKITFYWIAENASGVVNLLGWGGALSVGDPVDLTNTSSGNGGFEGTPTANVLSATESQILLDPSSELIDVSFMRSYSGNTNTGKIRFLGAKVEPVL